MLKNNYKILLSFLLIICIFLTGCGKQSTISDSQRFKKEYESINGKLDVDRNIIRELEIDENNPIVYSTADEIVEKIQNKESFVVYFGYASDPWCRSIIHTLLDVSHEESLNKLYYVDISQIRDSMSLDRNGNLMTNVEGTTGYKKLVELFKDYLSDYIITNDSGDIVNTKTKRIYAPTVIGIVKGEVSRIETGISKEFSDPYMELTDDVVSYMYDRFKCVIKCISEDSNSCSIEGC